MANRSTSIEEVKEILSITGLSGAEALEAMMEMSAQAARDNAEQSGQKKGKFWFLIKTEPTKEGTIVKALFGVDPQ